MEIILLKIILRDYLIVCYIQCIESVLYTYYKIPASIGKTDFKSFKSVDVHKDVLVSLLEILFLIFLLLNCDFDYHDACYRCFTNL